MLRDPAVETAKVRDGQASAFKQKGYYHKPSQAVKQFFQEQLPLSPGTGVPLLPYAGGAAFRLLSYYKEFTRSNIAVLNCFLRFRAVSMGI